MTVDLRTTPSLQRDNIIWESYEGTTVHILEESETTPFVYVSIETPVRELSQETLDLNYARLYPDTPLTELNSSQRGIA